MFKKGISLIQFMTAIIVLSIISVLAIPNIKNVRKNAEISTTLKNKINIQIAVDRYFLDNQEFPCDDIPTIGLPKPINWNKLIPKYLKEKPNDVNRIYYWIDFTGKVWVSDIDAPQNITINSDENGNYIVTWQEVQGAIFYEIGYFDNSLAFNNFDLEDINASTNNYIILGIINKSNPLEFSIAGNLRNKTIVVSSISENFKSVPVKEGYLGNKLENNENNQQKTLIGYTEDLIPKMTSYNQPSGIVTASSQDSVRADYAFDDSFFSCWRTTNLTGWLAYEFEEPKIIVRYTLSPHHWPTGGDADARKIMPSSWTFEGWDGEKWVVLDARENITDWKATWTSHETKEFIFDNNTPYKKYRINILKNNGSPTYLGIGEMEMSEGIYK